jgi:hypothetical protein
MHVRSSHNLLKCEQLAHGPGCSSVHRQRAGLAKHAEKLAYPTECDVPGSSLLAHNPGLSYRDVLNLVW